MVLDSTGFGIMGQAGRGSAFGVVRAIGLMSGTSLDGVDVELIETDGESVAGLGRQATGHIQKPSESCCDGRLRWVWR